MLSLESKNFNHNFHHLFNALNDSIKRIKHVVALIWDSKNNIPWEFWVGFQFNPLLYRLPVRLLPLISPPCLLFSHSEKQTSQPKFAKVSFQFFFTIWSDDNLTVILSKVMNGFVKCGHLVQNVTFSDLYPVTRQ